MAYLGDIREINSCLILLKVIFFSDRSVEFRASKKKYFLIIPHQKNGEFKLEYRLKTLTLSSRVKNILSF